MFLLRALSGGGAFLFGMAAAEPPGAEAQVFCSASKQASKQAKSAIQANK